MPEKPSAFALWLRGWKDDYFAHPLWPNRVVYTVAVIGLFAMVIFGMSYAGQLGNESGHALGAARPK